MIPNNYLTLLDRPDVWPHRDNPCVCSPTDYYCPACRAWDRKHRPVYDEFVADPDAMDPIVLVPAKAKIRDANDARERLDATKKLLTAMMNRPRAQRQLAKEKQLRERMRTYRAYLDEAEVRGTERLVHRRKRRLSVAVAQERLALADAALEAWDGPRSWHDKRYQTLYRRWRFYKDWLVLHSDEDDTASPAGLHCLADRILAMLQRYPEGMSPTMLAEALGTSRQNVRSSLANTKVLRQRVYRVNRRWFLRKEVGDVA